MTFTYKWQHKTNTFYDVKLQSHYIYVHVEIYIFSVANDPQKLDNVKSISSE